MTAPIGTRIRETLCYGWKELVRDLRIRPSQLSKILGKTQAQLPEMDSDPLWLDIDNLIVQRIAALYGLRAELAGKVEAERKRRLERRIRTRT